MPEHMHGCRTRVVLADDGEEPSGEDGIGALSGKRVGCGDPGASPCRCGPRRFRRKGGCGKNRAEIRRISEKGALAFDELERADMVCTSQIPIHETGVHHPQQWRSPETNCLIQNDTAPKRGLEGSVAAARERVGELAGRVRGCLSGIGWRMAEPLRGFGVRAYEGQIPMEEQIRQVREAARGLSRERDDGLGVSRGWSR